MKSNVIGLFPDIDPPKPNTEVASVRFEEFWKCFPRRTGKPLAKAKYDAIIRGGFKTKTFDRDSNSYVDIEITATEDQIIEGVKKYVRSIVDHNFKRTVEDKYLPHPATWLNQGRFMDFME